MSEEEQKKDDDVLEAGIKIKDIAKTVMKDKKEKEAVKRHKEADQKEKEVAAPSTTVPFAKGIEILADRQIPHLSNEYVTAYEAQSTVNPSKRYFAILCHDAFPPRKRSFKAFQAITHKCSAELFLAGRIKWLPENRYRYALILDNIYGQPLMPDLSKKYKPMSESELVSRVVKPMVAFLTIMDGVGFIHGAIRPNNLYRNLLDDSVVALGEGLSMPASSLQPAVFETVERAMADPFGRGMGSLSDDLYAFGVSLLCLLMGEDPTRKMTDEEIILSKIEKGTFLTLATGVRIPPGVGEVIKGLLVDDAKTRWSLEDLQKWVEGRRLTPKQSGGDPKASRSFDFKGKRFFMPRTLAVAMTKDIEGSMEIVEDGSLKKWIDRSQDDHKMSERYTNATYGSTGTQSFEQASLLTSKIAIALDPNAPVRYRGTSVRLEGISTMLAKAAILQKDQADLEDIIRKKIMVFWLGTKFAGTPDMTAGVDVLNSCESYIRKKAFGNGFERCLYFMNRELRCLSPVFDDYYVHDPISFLLALEEIIGKGEVPTNLFDRHVAAFLAVHFPKVQEGDIVMLASGDQRIRSRSILTLVATLQRYSDIESLPNLAGWIMSMMDPILSQYNGKSLKQRIVKEMKSLAKAGNINGMFKVIENKDILKRDMIDFQKAHLDYMRLEHERNRLENDLRGKIIGLKTGRYVAFFVCSVLAGVMFAAFLAYHYGGGF